jgi:pimeloyl-ACP methyl ester carboxylesterase
MASSRPLPTTIVEANGTQLYYEIRGAGPTLLFIPGAEGDAEEYTRVAGLLQDEFTILSYDRRGFSRSPRPLDYNGTTVDEQADDAAALLTATGLGPATIWGNSSGAIIGLALVIRHPEAVSGAMLHEPPLFAGMSDVGKVLESLKRATANGKVPFLMGLCGEATYNSFSEGYKQRLQADRTWIDFEFDNFEYYLPSDEELARVSTPVEVLCGSESPPFFMEAATWLAERLGGGVEVMPGDHGAHYCLPDEVAKRIRDFAAETWTQEDAVDRMEKG